MTDEKFANFVNALAYSFQQWADAKRLRRYLEGDDIGHEVLDQVPVEHRHVEVRCHSAEELETMKRLYLRVMTPEQLMLVSFLQL